MGVAPRAGCSAGVLAVAGLTPSCTLPSFHPALSPSSSDCTEEEVAKARRTPGVKVLELPGFLELLRFGVVMGVDDGCEPTREEVRRGIE